MNGTDFSIVLVFLQWRHVSLSLSAFVFGVLWFIVFTSSSSRDSGSFSSNSFSSCVTICSHVPFSTWAWFFGFFRCGGILAYMTCSMMASAAIPNACLANF